MMQCEESELYLSQLAFGGLNPESERFVQLQDHLGVCDSCREKLGDLRVAASLIVEAHETEPPARLSDDRRSALVKRFRGIDQPIADRTEPFRFPWRPVGIAASMALMGFAGLGLLQQSVTEYAQENAAMVQDAQSYDGSGWEESQSQVAFESKGSGEWSSRHTARDGQVDRSGYLSARSGSAKRGSRQDERWASLDDSESMDKDVLASVAASISNRIVDQSVMDPVYQYDNKLNSAADMSKNVRYYLDSNSSKASQQLSDYENLESGDGALVLGLSAESLTRSGKLRDNDRTYPASERVAQAVRSIRNRSVVDADGNGPVDAPDEVETELDSVAAVDPSSGTSLGPIGGLTSRGAPAYRSEGRQRSLDRLRESKKKGTSFFGIATGKPDSEKAPLSPVVTTTSKSITREAAPKEVHKPVPPSIAAPPRKIAPTNQPQPKKSKVNDGFKVSEDGKKDNSQRQKLESFSEKPQEQVAGGGGGLKEKKLDEKQRHLPEIKSELEDLSKATEDKLADLNIAEGRTLALEPGLRVPTPSGLGSAGQGKDKGGFDDDKQGLGDRRDQTRYSLWMENLDKEDSKESRSKFKDKGLPSVASTLLPGQGSNKKYSGNVKPGSTFSGEKRRATGTFLDGIPVAKGQSEGESVGQKVKTGAEAAESESLDEERKRPGQKWEKGGKENERKSQNEIKAIEKEVGVKNSKILTLKDRRESESAGEGEEDPKANQELGREKQIQELLRDTADFRRDLNYEKALEKNEELLVIDPDNIAGQAMKEMIEEAVIARKFDSVIARRSLEQAKHQIENESSVVPFRDVIVYPPDWPQLSLLRNQSASEETMATQRAMSKLKTPIALSYKNNTFEDVVEHYESVTGLNVQVNWSALESAGIDRKSTVSLELNSVPADKALDLILSQRGGDSGKLTYAVEAGSLSISTEKNLQQQQALRSYDLRSLMATVPNENRQKHLKGIVDELKRSGAKQVDVLNDTVVVNANGKGHSAVQNRLNELTRNAQIKARDRAQAEEADDRLPASSKFKQMPVNPFVMAQVDRFSTFGIDTDTASYTLARRYIQAGYRPPAGSVRMEEFVNSFDYNYPSQGGRLFTTHAEAGPSPFGKKLTLVKVGVQAKTIGRAARKPAHLVFLVDASGSMDRDDRLPLAKFSLKTLVGQLGQKDRITLIAYGTRTHLVLDAASASDHKRIAQAIDSIQAGRSTNMIDALGSAYTQAKRHFKAGQINRVILCSDGVANIGATDAEAMLRRVETDRKQGVTLTTVGFGVGGYNDQLMEQLANRGDGQYVFVDSHQEARRVFVDQLGATLQTVAKDTKIQVEFNTSRVRRYRLVGYENRDIADKDFRNDKVDAGEVGSGQSATALYEVELVGRPGHEAGHDLGTVRIRYRDLETNKIEEIAQRLTSGLVQKRTPQTHPRFFLAASAAEFAEILRRSPHARGSRLAHVQRVMERVVRTLPLDKRAAELLNLIRSTEGLPDAP